MEKQFWTQLHLSMPQRDAEERRREEEEEAREDDNKEWDFSGGSWAWEKKNRERAAESKEEREAREKREAEETAALSPAERAERDRQRAEDEGRMAIAYKMKELFLPRDSLLP